MTELNRAVARTALAAVPRFEGPDQLSDHAMTAWQFGCMALVAMGVAERRLYGCELTVLRDQVLGALHGDALWLGDAGFVLLALGGQTGDLKALYPERKAKWTVKPAPGASADDWFATPAPAWMTGEQAAQFERMLELGRAEQIRARQRRDIQPLHPGDRVFRAHPELIAPLEQIGWIVNDQWAEAAQEALMRDGTAAIPSDLLDHASTQARADMPDDVAAAIDAIWAPPPMDLIKDRARDWWARDRRFIETRPATARIRGPSTLQEMCDTLEQRWPDIAMQEVTQMFEHRWRLSFGWDSPAGLIPLFHDRLASAVARQVSET